MFNVVELLFNVFLTCKMLPKDDSQFLYLFVCLWITKDNVFSVGSNVFDLGFAIKETDLYNSVKNYIFYGSQNKIF